MEHHLEGSWMSILEPARVRGATYTWLSYHLTSLAANAVNPREVASSVGIAEALHGEALRVCPIDKAPDLQLNTTEYSPFMWSLHRRGLSLRQQMTRALVPTLINNAAAGINATAAAATAPADAPAPPPPTISGIAAATVTAAAVAASTVAAPVHADAAIADGCDPTNAVPTPDDTADVWPYSIS